DSIRVDVDRAVEDIVAVIVHELETPLESRSSVVARDRGEPPTTPQIKPELEHATIVPRRSNGKGVSIGSDLPMAIEDYALIGDCTTAALVGRNGSIDWLCWPRLDSNACFAALLGTSEHGRWKICPADPAPRVSRAYHHGTMVLETVFDTGDGRVSLIDFMPMGHANSSIIRLVKGQRGK